MSVTGAGFGMFQEKLVTPNKELLFLDDIFLSLWLTMLIVKLLHFQIRY